MKIRNSILFISFLLIVCFHYSCKENELMIGNLQGRIASAETNEPLAGVSVNITSTTDQTNSTSLTDQNGNYSFPDLSVGQYNIQAQKNAYATQTLNNITVKAGETTTADMQMQPLSAELQVSHLSIDFENSLTTKTIDIKNLSTAKLVWSVVENCNWLSANPTAGEITSETRSVALTVDRNGMKPGAYSNSMAVVSNGGSANIDIRMQVGVGNLPLLYVSTMHLDFNQGQVSLPIDIRNNGSETLEWSAVEHVNWMTITPNAGTTTTEIDNIVITVNSSGLQTGTYAQEIIINSNGGSATILVNMFVGESANTDYAITRHATNVARTTATLNGTVTPQNMETTVEFEYGTSESYGNAVTATQSPVNGNTDIDVNTNITGLEENTTYHYRIKIQNASGTYYGVDMLFTTTIEEGTIEIVSVTGGTFEMGCTNEQNNCENDETPVHTVTLNDFEISKYEITNQQYADFMNAIGVNSSGSYNGTKYLDIDASDCQISHNGNSFVVAAGKENYPVIEVTWDGANAFCEYCGGRLPTEAEWEFAARGGNSATATLYAGNDNLNDVGWYTANSEGSTHEVGFKAPNELGLYDMSGNVFEWCADWYAPDYYSNSPQNNPQGPEYGLHRILRGGSWEHSATYSRVAYRYSSSPSSSSNQRGFRLVLVP